MTPKWYLLNASIVCVLTAFFIRYFLVENPQTVKKNSEYVVTLTSGGYEPNFLKISLGDKVIFRSLAGKPHWPASNTHPEHTLYPEFDPKQPLAASEDWSFTFERLGTHPFHDHVRSYYEGTIVVSESL